MQNNDDNKYKVKFLSAYLGLKLCVFVRNVLAILQMRIVLCKLSEDWRHHFTLVRVKKVTLPVIAHLMAGQRSLCFRQWIDRQTPAPGGLCHSLPDGGSGANTVDSSQIARDHSRITNAYLRVLFLKNIFITAWNSIWAFQ